MWAIGELHKLVGENYKDKNECAKGRRKLIRAYRNDSTGRVGELSRTLRQQ